MSGAWGREVNDSKFQTMLLLEEKRDILGNKRVTRGDTSTGIWPNPTVDEARGGDGEGLCRADDAMTSSMQLQFYFFWLNAIAICETLKFCFNLYQKKKNLL